MTFTAPDQLFGLSVTWMLEFSDLFEPRYFFHIQN